VLARLLCLLLLPGAARAAQAAPSVLLATGEFSPYVVSSQPGGGPVSEIVQAAFQEAGLQAELLYVPWPRAEAMLRAGRVFATYPYRKTPERAAAFDFSAPLFVQSGRFFYLKSRFPQPPAFHRLADLKGLAIGGVLGYWYAPLFAREGLRVDFASSDEAAMQKLKLGRVELVPQDETRGWWLIGQLFPGQNAQFATLSTPLDQGSSHLMVSRSYPDAARLLARFNQGLAKIRASGRLQSIWAKYRLHEPGSAEALQ